MTTYHKIILNGVTFFREFDSSCGFYGQDRLSEKELIEQLMDEAVESSIEIDEDEVVQAIRTIPSIIQREMVQNYITYLEMMAEPLE